MIRALLTFLICLILPLESWGEIYRSVDKQGRTVYSDAPKPGASVIELPPLSTIPLPAPPKKPEVSEPQPADQVVRPYSTLTIAMPGDEETIHDNSGSLEVGLTLSPPLQTEHGHRIKVFLDGEALSETWGETHFSLADLIPRGTHTLQVAVVDRSGQPVVTSAMVTFYMWRASARFPGRGAPQPPFPQPDH